MHSTVAVLGGGLAGLNAARLLHQAGVDVQLYEARDRFGGRVLTDAGLDLGPSWFWPQLQPDIAALVSELDLPCFAQYSIGDAIVEWTSREGPQRHPMPSQQPQSFRLERGSAALIEALVKRIPSERLHLARAATGLMLAPGDVTVCFGEESASAEYVIVTLPPRVLALLHFSPDLPEATIRLWNATPTWMAPHAKFFATYTKPFWRDNGLSGTAQSRVGPLPEIHDACTADGQAALFGFIGISASDRVRLGAAAVTDACVTQLVRLFGPAAATPLRTLIMDWASEPLTAVPLDLMEPGHPEPRDEWVHGDWADRMILAGTEAAPREPGYLAGAVAASVKAVERLRDQIG